MCDYYLHGSVNQISDVGLRYLHDSLEKNSELASMDLEGMTISLFQWMMVIAMSNKVQPKTDNLIEDTTLLEETRDLLSMNASHTIKHETKKAKVEEKFRDRKKCKIQCDGCTDSQH
jgi:hypothetical protein